MLDFEVSNCGVKIDMYSLIGNPVSLPLSLPPAVILDIFNRGSSVVAFAFSFPFVAAPSYRAFKHVEDHLLCDLIVVYKIRKS